MVSTETNHDTHYTFTKFLLTSSFLTIYSFYILFELHTQTSVQVEAFIVHCNVYVKAVLWLYQCNF